MSEHLIKLKEDEDYNYPSRPSSRENDIERLVALIMRDSATIILGKIEMERGESSS